MESNSKALNESKLAPKEKYWSSKLSSFVTHCESLLSNLNLILLNLKKELLGELIQVYQVKQIFSQNQIIRFLKQKKSSYQSIIIFFNLPYIISTLTIEILESIKKKTIYLYRSLFFLSIPIILYYVNNTFVLQEKKDYLSFILPEKKKVFSEKEHFFITKLKKEIFYNNIVNFLNEKIEKKKSPILYLSNHKAKTHSNTSAFNNLKFFKKTTKLNTKRMRKFSKSILLYNKIKDNLTRTAQPEYNSTTDKLKYLSISTSNPFSFLRISQFSKKRKIMFQNNKNFLQTSFFLKEKIENSFLSFIKPQQLNYLQKFNYLYDLEKNNEQVRKKFLLNSKISYIKAKMQNTTDGFYSTKSPSHWRLKIIQWIDLYSSKPKKNFSSKKQTFKDNLQGFTKLNLISKLSTNFLNKQFGKPLVNFANWSYYFVHTIEQDGLNGKYNQEKLLKNKSYKTALPVKISNFHQTTSSLVNTYNHFPYLPLHLKNTNNIAKKINYLYNFSLQFPNRDNFIFFNPELLLPLNNNRKGNSNPFFSLYSFPNIHDIDFYLSSNETIDNSFWIPFSLTQKDAINHKEKIQNEEKYNVYPNYSLIRKKREKLQNILISKKSTLLQKYNKWIFTYQWWLFQKYRFLKEIQFLLEKLDDKTRCFLRPVVQKTIGEWNKLWSIYLNQFKNENKNLFLFQNENWNKFFTEETYKLKQQKSIWESLNLLLLVPNTYGSFFAWFITSSLIYYHWLPMITGLIYIYLWRNFEKIRSLSHPSWKTFLSILVENSFDSPSQQLRLSSYSAKGWILWIFSQFYAKLMGFSFISNQVFTTPSLDISRKKKNLIINSLITEKALFSKYKLWSINRKKENSPLNGFTFFQKWSTKNYRVSSFLQNQNNLSISYSLNWLNDLYFYIRYSYSDYQKQTTFLTFNIHAKPKPLLEPISFAKRWLFIGALDSGKSYAIKNISASTHYPLIHLSLKDIKRATPDSKYQKIKKQKKWIEQLSERGFFLENILNLAKILAPCILWIPDLHEFHTKFHIRKKNTQRYDTSVLVAILLKILSVDLLPERESHITFVGSSDHPRLLDPKFVSRHRLDLIVNFRKPFFDQRLTIFNGLLNNKGFSLKGSYSFDELGSNTIGYNFRDLTSLVNETLLIKTKENTKLVDINTLRIALYRKTSTQSFNNILLDKENLRYKIGKALVQVTLVYPKSILFISRYRDIWKNRFYYLSNAYLELSNKKSITTEFTILTHILNCLAGSAARDAWIFSTKNFQKSTLALNNQLKHDFSIASSLLQSLFVEFPMQHINGFNNDTTKNQYSNYFQGKYKFTLLQKAISYLDFFYQFPSYIDWSFKIQRLSSSWVIFFSGIQRYTKNLNTIGSDDKMKENTFLPILGKSVDINLPYERRETKRQQKSIKKIESLFNRMIFQFKFEGLGSPGESEYVIDYNPFQFSLFLLEARSLWNPQTLLPSFSIMFFDRDLLINQKMLTKLYITYGDKFQSEKLNRKRIKKQFFWSSVAERNFDLNKKSEQKEGPIDFKIKDFNYYNTLIKVNAQLEQAQIQLPVYLHQGWTTPDHNETLRHFELVRNKASFFNNNVIIQESALFETLLEIYHHLFKFFIKNKEMMESLEDRLKANYFLDRKDLERFMKEKKFF